MEADEPPVAERRSDRFYPPAPQPWRNPPWKVDGSPEEVQQKMRVKGETRDLVEHADRVLMEANNTSIDAPWWVHPTWGISDVYTLAVMAVFLAPIMVIFWLPMFTFLLPPVLLNRLYIALRLREGADVVPRGALDWKLHCLIQFVLCVPALLLAASILLYSHMVMTVFGWLYLAVSACVRGKRMSDRLRDNQEVLQPYQQGPFLLWHFEDCVAAVAGSVYRQHFFEFMLSFTNMFFLTPWWKYWVTGNIYLENLGERFITQIGKSMDDMPLAELEGYAQLAISRAKPSRVNRQEIDAKTFAPHYPYPPANRRYAIGMQHTSVMTNFVHTTHYHSPETTTAGEGRIASLSHSAAMPLYRVLLWRNNPYHVYTGYVEANISNGMPSQPEKLWGGEHPMWLVNSHNKLAADRNVSWSLGHIDNFFDDFIPQFSHFIRMNVRGKEVADEYLSKDRRLGYEQAQQYQRMAEI